jgi:MFS family permease
LALGLFFLLLATTAFSNGVATPAWFTMIGKVLPTQRRGIFFGLSGGLGALMGIVGAYFVGRILESRPFPHNFAWLFMWAFAFTVISWVGLALNREPESLVVKAKTPLRQYLRQLPAILGRDPNYRRFMVSYMISKLGAMATGFFLVFGNDNFILSGRHVAWLTGVLIGTQALMNLTWGLVSDRWGHKLVLTGSAFAFALAAALASLTLWLTLSLSWFTVAFVLLGAGLAGDSVSRFSIVLEFCPPEDHPTYIGLTNTLLAPVVTLAPLIGGWLAEIAGYQTMFATAMAVAVLGGLCLALWVREPRYQ